MAVVSGQKQALHELLQGRPGAFQIKLELLVEKGDKQKLYVLGTTNSPTEHQQVVVLGFTPTASGSGDYMRLDAPYQFVLLVRGEANKCSVESLEVVEGGFKRTGRKVEYVQSV